jgi:hypothetical protein
MRNQFKIDLQQSITGGVARLTWPIDVEKNPNNPGHVNSWDQANVCITNPLTGATGACTDGGHVSTTISANALLGYSPTYLTYLMSSNNGTTGGNFVSTAKPTARFSYKVVNGTHVYVDASSSMGTGNTYQWDFNGVAKSGAVTDHDFVTSGTYTVTVTVTNSIGATDTKLFRVALTQKNNAPTANGTMSALVSTVTVTDLSMDLDSDTVTILINWGDGNSTTTTQGGTASHTYRDGTYTIRLSAYDSKGGSSLKTLGTVTLPFGLGSINGVVTDNMGTALTGAVVGLYSANSPTVIQQVYTASSGTVGEYIFTNVPVGGAYDIKVKKIGYVFTLVEDLSVPTNIPVTRDIQADTLYIISGTIVSEVTGTTATVGVNAVVVQLQDSTGTVVLQQVMTDGAGKYRFPNVVGGGTDYMVEPKTTLTGKVTPAPVTVTVTGDETADFTYTLIAP